MGRTTRGAVLLGLAALVVAAAAAVQRAAGDGAPTVPPSEQVQHTPAPVDADAYWTDERMRDAVPAPMPAPGG